MEGNERDERDELPDDDIQRPLLPPDDRVWRHPSELGSQAAPPVGGSGPTPSVPTGPADAPAGDGPGLWTVGLASGLIGSVLTFGLVVATGGLERPRTIVKEVVVKESVLPALATEARPTPDGSVVDIAERMRPAIVRLDVKSDNGQGSGSGVLFRDNGYLLTNAHVVREASSVNVILANGDELDGDVVGRDDRTDIAVVKIEAESAFPIATLGSAVNLKVGQPAIAIGSPLGLAGGPSVTTGVISALGRRLDTVRPALLDMIQTDAPIAPGSSGGALLDEAGAVIGITTAIGVTEVGAEGLGFATPIDVARSVADDIIETGKARHPWLGVSGTYLDDVSESQLGLDGGARVSEVIEGSPADEAGIRDGDVIVGIDNETVDSMAELVVLLRRFRPGYLVHITYMRDGEQHVAEIRLGELPANFPDQ